MKAKSQPRTGGRGVEEREVIHAKDLIQDMSWVLGKQKEGQHGWYTDERADEWWETSPGQKQRPSRAWTYAMGSASCFLCSSDERSDQVRVRVLGFLFNEDHSGLLHGRERERF